MSDDSPRPPEETPAVKLLPIIHLIPTIPVTLRRQWSKLFAAAIGGIGALLSVPVESWLPHLSALFGPKAAGYGPVLVAIAFFWQLATNGRDIQKLHQERKKETI